MTNTIDVVGAFSDEDQSVINWGGNNYYRACGEPIVVNEDGSGSTCVKRVDHPGDIHEDFDGVRKTVSKDQMILVAAFPLAKDLAEGHAHTQAVAERFRQFFSDESLQLTQFYAAIKEQADQVIMILEGDG